jgi:tRNA threonylcarbamoyladenosine biosynthesis protein TsaE
MTITTHSPEETIALGKKIGARLRGGDVIAFRGDLGAGKTTMTRGIAVGMGLPDEVTSPTFALLNEYREEGVTPLCHFDMYRIGSSEELDAVGFYDCLEEGCAVAVEWSENIEDALPEDTVFIELKRIDDDTREIIITGDERFEDIGN